MKNVKPTYKRAVELVAYNDNDSVTDTDEIASFITVGIIAELFGKDIKDVARDIHNLRIKDREETQ